MNKLRTVILEDEDGNRNWLLDKLNQYSELDIVGEAATLDDSFRLIAETKPDAAFMDIQLIGGDVFTLLNRLQENGLHIPYIVMTTGFPEYVMSALNDYHRFVVQYLVKPFLEDWEKKLRKSIDALIAAKINDKTLEVRQTQDSIFIKNRGNILRFDLDKIAYLEAAGGGETKVVTDTDEQQVDLTLSKFLELLPSERFQRISKINIINSVRILRINREDRTVAIEWGLKQKELGIGDIFYTEMLKNLPIGNGAVVKTASVKAPIKKFDLVTVMFCTIKERTGNSENVSSENRIKNIDYCFRKFDEILKKHNIERIRTIDNCYVCAGGLSKSEIDNPARVVEAAIEMHKFLKELNMNSQHQPQFEARIGIHSGPVDAVAVGHQNFNYDIWGDTVTLASEIEQFGSVGQIKLTSYTYHHVKRNYACRYAGTVDTKGIGEVEVYLIEVS